jgi:hypothetical protein
MVCVRVMCDVSAPPLLFYAHTRTHLITTTTIGSTGGACVYVFMVVVVVVVRDVCS